jgi:tetratricopeptide (TPR) repeat protein
MALERNDTVVTRRGSAALRFVSDGSQLRIGPNSRVQINESAAQRDVEVFFGRLWARIVSWRDVQTRVRTGSTIAAVRGTEVAVDFDEQQTVLWVFEGQVMAENPAGTLMLTSGQSAVAAPGQAPVLQVMVRPQDAVQWSLYYMPVVFETPEELAGEEDWQRAIRESTQAYREGDLGRALDLIEAVSDADISDARFFSYRASLLLAAGSVDEAATDIERALGLDSRDADTLALQSIIAVALNDKRRALSIARNAVAADPQSAAALIAMSYAQQAMFDLEAARETLQGAVESQPTNALVWARLAELHLSFGYLGDALAAARTSVEHEPNLVRSQTVLGYAYLTQVRTGAAKEAFTKAIELDQGDPVPRLGLGLAMIREGDLTGGGREIEVASSLDPGNALVRSYLGKAYFEERRIGLDEREYTLAKDIDPLDPTPWFYDAIAKQTINQPVAALRDLERAIELNDNRAVYRSRLLLDSDLAARSASLGRVYSDLGFQNLALVEGWKSVNTDPSNFSAHRLLADSYAALPRHEIARVSELFQSQMLQPLNTTPIQPRLGESNLFLLASQGPGALGFNEFNPLFNRDQVKAQGSFMAGEDDTLTGEAIVSGIYRKFSFSVGYGGFETDGFRENNDLKNQIANVFTQVEIGPSTSIQAEYRYRDDERGDLLLRFFPEDFAPGERNTEERHAGRVGVRHTVSPGSILLGSLTYLDARATLTDDQQGFFVAFLGFERSESGYGAEVQHLYRSRHINLTTGIGYFDIDGAVDTRVEFNPFLIPPPFNVFEESFITDLKHTNVYAYSYINPVEQVTVTAGLSADFLSGESPDVGEQDQVNPKVGITWNPVPGTTLRAAAHRVLRRTLITDQTLEPTQVAGFNQLFDDVIGTRAWRYGGAIDQKITEGWFAGAEYSKRDIESPFTFLDEEDDPVFRREDVEERLARAYLFSAPHPWLALRAEYVFERLKSEGEIGLPTKLETHRVPLGIGFFHPSGFSASLTATYFDQKGDFVRFGGERESGSDKFWTVDVGVNYRLPKRFGFLAVGATNVFDEQFNFFDIDDRNPIIQPARRAFARVTLAF